MNLRPYLDVLRVPGISRPLFSALVGRMTAGMAALSIVLTVQHSTGSFATAGAVAGTYTVSAALGAPLQGRLIDRLGQPRVLLPAVGLFSLAFLSLAVAAQAGLATGALVACAALAGVTLPSLSATMRTVWSATLGRRHAPGAATRVDSPPVADCEPGMPVHAHTSPLPSLQTAYALDSTLQELIFITGPMLVALLVSVASPLAAMVVGCALAVVGTVSFATSPVSRAWRGQPAAKDWAGPLRSGGMRTLVAGALLVGGSIGLMEVSIPAFASAHGRAGVAGVLLALWSLGSLGGGLVFGARQWPGTSQGRFLALSWLIALSLLGPASAGSLPLLAVALPLAGMFLAPWLATLSLLVDRLAPAGTVTEAFTWVFTGFLTGIAGGISVGGSLIEASGTRLSFMAAALAAAVGATVITTARRTLAPR